MVVRPDLESRALRAALDSSLEDDRRSKPRHADTFRPIRSAGDQSCAGVRVAIRHPDDPVDEQTGIGHGRRILFELEETQKVDENRVHLDLNVGRDRIGEETERLQSVGATLIYERRDSPRGVFNRMADPEGNEFCVGAAASANRARR